MGALPSAPARVWFLSTHTRAVDGAVALGAPRARYPRTSRTFIPSRTSRKSVRADPAQALADLDRAVALDGDSPDALTLNNRGNARGAVGDWSGAMADYQLARRAARSSKVYCTIPYRIVSLIHSTYLRIVRRDGGLSAGAPRRPIR